jgi:hypothetical protein
MVNSETAGIRKLKKKDVLRWLGGVGPEWGGQEDQQADPEREKEKRRKKQLKALGNLRAVKHGAARKEVTARGQKAVQHRCVQTRQRELWGSDKDRRAA